MAAAAVAVAARRWWLCGLGFEVETEWGLLESKVRRSGGWIEVWGPHCLRLHFPQICCSLRRQTNLVLHESDSFLSRFDLIKDFSIFL